MLKNFDTKIVNNEKRDFFLILTLTFILMVLGVQYGVSNSDKDNLPIAEKIKSVLNDNCEKQLPASYCEKQLPILETLDLTDFVDAVRTDRENADKVLNEIMFEKVSLPLMKNSNIYKDMCLSKNKDKLNEDVHINFCNCAADFISPKINGVLANYDNFESANNEFVTIEKEASAKCLKK